MKVKVFDCINENDLTEEINEFIKDKEVIDIKYSVALTMYEDIQIYCFTALIMYRELVNPWT